MTQKKELQIEVRWLLELLWRKLWLIALVTAACMALSLAVTRLFVTPLYRSSAMFYVNNYVSLGDEQIIVESSDLNAAQRLVDSYMVILKTGDTLEEVITQAQVELTAAQLQDMIFANAVNSTEIFQITVTGPDPQEAQRIADAITAILPGRIQGIIQSTSAKIVDTAVIPSAPTFPSYGLNGLIGFCIGFVCSVVFVILRGLTDVKIRGEEDIVCEHPVLVSVPDMEAVSHGGYYGYGARKPKKGSPPVLLGRDISFAAAESYKLLRTKLQFFFSDKEDGCIVGISSALAGEGKSLSAINLAYSLSQLGDKVLLVDCDLRRPTLAEKLSLARIPGLSDYLSGQCGLDEIFRDCGLAHDEQTFTVIPAGSETPNPIELLNSERMSDLLAQLRSRFEYIILDFPPVGEVSDALVMAEKTDGMLLVVRRNYCTRSAFESMVRQFAFVQAKILGIVCNCATENTDGYTGQYYKKSYRPRFGKDRK